MMIRFETIRSEQYHADKKLITLAVNCIHSLLQHYLNPLHKISLPNTTPKSYDDEMEESLTFICNKVNMLSAGALSSNLVKGNGLHFSQKRMWETLVALLLMQYSIWRDTKIKSFPVGPTKKKGRTAAAKKDTAGNLARQVNLHLKYAKELDCPPVSWAAVTKKWEEMLDEDIVTQAALVDLVNEITHPGTSLLYEGTQAQHIDLPANSFPQPIGTRADWGETIQGLAEQERGPEGGGPEPQKKSKKPRTKSQATAAERSAEKASEDAETNTSKVGQHTNDAGERPEGQQIEDDGSDNKEESDQGLNHKDGGKEEREQQVDECSLILNSVSVSD
ncbi:hypothetical protein MJO28_016759 [Puccinia striiformis f. sp. tritici]|uniref:Uncharacterized protein n=3 Tax=Puccinia striiformis TaxID=27350 RepID=A0A0L0UZX1_9BASI|nr:hypothetical protein Pst134EB_030721 [Puccinia striiformis f. sp. tritici]KAI7935888.1 hypothetical protein MJO28_016759 [Puccinia striiformis f. sp. tritici]KAI9626942.1 hypothetical protein H4Q26_017629 [Puccinia striiformis f. sp. tritici PST-130]KNE92583.1 hypothetical protein PSTG_14017 [Puccinia striiformis f. sp. tritici PST-78]POW02646.1 hypothetical protein PSHT_12032 [Puccinia striiformis]